MKKLLPFLAAACVAAVAAACGDADDAAVDAPPHADDWQKTGDDLGAGSLRPRPEGRVARRLSIAQLDETLKRTFGKTWALEVPGGGQLEIFPILGPMLGQPDYLTENVESLEPTPLFAKFMDNMASRVCTDAVFADLAEPPPAEPVIVRFKSNVDQNLRYLRLRLHGVWVAEGSTKEIADLRALYDELAANAEQPVTPELLGWLGVCIAMVTSPEFMTY